jgi:hypothetical protein
LLVCAGKYLRGIYRVESVLLATEIAAHFDVIALRQNAVHFVCT